jgi:hypothetical protein
MKVDGGSDATSTASGTNAPLVRPPPAPISSQKARAIVGLVLGGVALVTFATVGVALRREPPARAEGAVTTTVAEPPAPASTAPVEEEPQPTAEVEVAQRPRNNEGLLVIESPEATQVSVDGKVVGTTPMAPIAVAAGPHRLFFRHATLGERALLIQAKAGETSTATADFETRAPQPSRPRKAEKRLPLP